MNLAVSLAAENLWLVVCLLWYL